MQIHTDENVDTFILSLEESTIAKALRTIDLLEKFGHQLGLPHSKKVSAGIFELRVRGRQEVRIFYCFHTGSIHLLHGFVKKSQRIPPRELRRAISRFNSLTKYNL